MHAFSKGRSRSHRTPSTYRCRQQPLMRRKKLPAHLRDNDALREALRHLLRDVHGARLPGLPLALRAVGHSNRDFVAGLRCTESQDSPAHTRQDIGPATNASYSAFSSSKILMRWSKNSGRGCSCTRGRQRGSGRRWLARRLTSNGCPSVAATFFFSFGVFAGAPPACGLSRAGICAGCAVVWAGWVAIVLCGACSAM